MQNYLWDLKRRNCRSNPIRSQLYDVDALFALPDREGEGLSGNHYRRGFERLIEHAPDRGMQPREMAENPPVAASLSPVPPPYYLWDSHRLMDSMTGLIPSEEC